MKKKKTRLKNIIIVGSIITFFAIFTIIIINIAQGKKVTPDGRIVDTAIIRLNTIPEEVTAYIDGVRVSQIENRIEGIEVGEITLRLEKDGHSSWEKTITLEAGKVKNVYAQLYPMDLNFEQITNTNVDKIFFSRNADNVFYTVVDSETDSQIGLWKYKITRNLLDFGSNEPERIATFDDELISFLKNSSYSIQIAGDSNYVLLLNQDNGISYIYNANRLNDLIKLNEKLGYLGDKYFWFKNSESLIIEKDNILFEYEVNSGRSNLIFFNPGQSPIFAVNGDTLYFYNQMEGIISEYVNRDIQSIRLPKDFSIPKTINKMYTLAEFPEILLIESSEGLFYLDFSKNYSVLIDSEAVVEKIANDGKSVLYKKNDEFITFNLEESFDAQVYRTQTTKLSVDNSMIESIYYSSNSTNLISLLVNDAGGIELWLMDSDGQNSIKLVNDETPIGLNSQITVNGTALYILLDDSSTSEESPTENNQSNQDPTDNNAIEGNVTEPETVNRNIYKLNLEIK